MCIRFISHNHRCALLLFFLKIMYLKEPLLSLLQLFNSSEYLPDAISIDYYLLKQEHWDIIRQKYALSDEELEAVKLTVTQIEIVLRCCSQQKERWMTSASNLSRCKTNQNLDKLMNHVNRISHLYLSRFTMAGLLRAYMMMSEIDLKAAVMPAFRFARKQDHVQQNETKNKVIETLNWFHIKNLPPETARSMRSVFQKAKPEFSSILELCQKMQEE